MLVAVDSSVFVAALRLGEAQYELSRLFLQKLVQAEHTAVAPLTVLVEVAAAVRRRTGSESLAQRAVQGLIELANVHFLPLTETSANVAIAVAVSTGLRGMDAIVVGVAHDFSCPLMTLDPEMANGAGGLVETPTLEQL